MTFCQSCNRIDNFALEKTVVAIDPRKRQKKLERRKAKLKAQRRDVAGREPKGLSARIQQASTAPILHCCMNTEIWRQGIGHVLVSRQLGAGQVAFAAFLVDVYCLGVKNAMANIVPRAQYGNEIYRKLASQDKLNSLRPECARKLVESAVQYAADLGLPPHSDYRKARLIFGDIAAAECEEDYTFGKDGKPFFVAGPHDNSVCCQQIIRTLYNHCGPDGYHFLISGGDELLP